MNSTEIIMEKISNENWTFTHYKSSKIRAFISHGGEPTSDFEDGFKELYLVTTSNEDLTKEFFQKPFQDIEKAVEFINKRYGHWEFLDLLKTPGNESSSGCSTCAAH